MSFAAPDANGVIFQSGRDYDLSNLVSNTGVTTTTDNGITYYDFGTNRLWIQGTVWHDPDKEVMLFHHNSTSASATTHVLKVKETGTSRSWHNISSWSVDSDGNYVINHTGHSVEVGDALRFRSVTGSAIEQRQARVLSVTAATITLERGYYWAGLDSDNSFTITTANGQYTRIPTYNYGKEYTNYGRTGYSDGTGVIISGSSTSAYDPDEHGFFFDQFAFLWSRGGTIVSNRPCAIDGHYDIKNTTFMCPRQNASGDWQPVEMRNMGDGWWDNGKLININGVDPKNTKQIDVVLENACVSEVLNSWYEFSFRNFDASKNFGVCDFGHDGSFGVNGTLSNGSWSGNTVSHHHHDFEIVNSATGSNVVTMWRPVQRNPNAQRGNVVTKKEISFNFEDASGNPIQGVELYLIDNPSDYAKNATFPPATAAGSYTTTPTLLNGVINSDGSITYDYTTPFEYNATSDANGHVSTLKITTSSHIHEYNANDPAAKNDYPDLHLRSNNQWGFSSTDTRGPDFSDWDTDNFGGFYRVDRRSNDNTDADEFTFQFCSYNHSLASSTQTLKGVGELEVNWVLFDDLLITDTRLDVDAYQQIDTPEKFYNRAKAYLVDNYAGETSTIVTREGNSIDAGTYNVVVDKQAADVFTYNQSTDTITVSADTFVGNINTTGSTTLNNDAVVVGTFGADTVLQWKVKNIEATTRIQLYNTTAPRQGVVYTNKYTGTPGEYVDVTGLYDTTEIVAGDVVRLRCTCVVGAEAMLPTELTAVATSTGLTFQVEQTPDTVYNSNGIDGSTLDFGGTTANDTRTLSADYVSPMGIDVSDADGTASVKQIYAFFVYSTTTEDGVDVWFKGMRAIDNANYEVDVEAADIKIQNVGNNAVVVSDGRLFRNNQTSVLYAEDGDKPISMDSGALVTSVQPQVEAALNANSKVLQINSNSNLIPGLL